MFRTTEDSTAARPRFAEPGSLLRFSLRIDAIAAGLGGISLLIESKWLVELLGPSLRFQVVHAIFCVGYGATVFAFSRVSLVNLRAAGLIVIAINIMATVGYVLAVAMRWVPLTTVGVAGFLVCATYTAVMAGIQLLGLRRLRG
ncbi:hypothetical protein FZI91_09705 [Mycobacterium sp. CBMA271]|uniref:hypothetical protein n=1 Tax=unclassified Mycobacteroides TaxID=2618759 RepID=UPI0012DE7032|nr:MULTISPECIES: hypothetical protein [unclassified Mycobacteroides]MUM15705.1 hypothetical protein [Mycobacteroides sp. CBMA 326]MUM17500.1 hypothetical protein [Mycobacteroides sp. CBMA 326]MUM21977.1 hypothetical protein [Mycobacteroides sp. CBMA 271]